MTDSWGIQVRGEVRDINAPGARNSDRLRCIGDPNRRFDDTFALTLAIRLGRMVPHAHGVERKTARHVAKQNNLEADR